MAVKEEGGWFDWAYRGVDHSLPGNGGLECRDYLSLPQRFWETLLASSMAICALLYAIPRLRLPCLTNAGYLDAREPFGKRLLLMLMAVTFGIELGFKFATRRMIWIWNPCHVTTMVQIFILTAPPSRAVTAAFRLHLHMLTGAPIAILFPVINTRLLPFETAVYFLQHILMLVIPFYLLKSGGPFVPEKLLDLSWALTSFGVLFIYHFVPLQVLAYVSEVNLNNNLCPAVSDPFHGQYYRLFAMAHQLILIPTFGKILLLLAKTFMALPNEGVRVLKEIPVFGTSLTCPNPGDSKSSFIGSNPSSDSNLDSAFVDAKSRNQSVYAEEQTNGIPATDPSKASYVRFSPPTSPDRASDGQDESSTLRLRERRATGFSLPEDRESSKSSHTSDE